MNKNTNDLEIIEKKNKDDDIGAWEYIYDDDGGDGLINPTILVKQVADYQAQTEHGNEQGDGDDLSIEVQVDVHFYR